MVRDGQEQAMATSPGPGRRSWASAARWTVRGLLALGGTAAAAFLISHLITAQPGDPPKNPPTGLFRSWPNAKPDLVVVMTGERQGYLKFCGCSDPQYGGLERLYNLLEDLRTKRGWPVVPVDLGNIPLRKGLHDQAVLKYDVAMQAYEKMGYTAVGLGVNEFEMPLWDLLATYPLNQKQRYPRLLAATLKKTSKDPQTGKETEKYPAAPGDPRKTLIGDWEIVTGPNHPALGVLALVGQADATRAATTDPGLEFLDNRTVYNKALQEMRQQGTKPEVMLMLFQGEVNNVAKNLAPSFEPFHAILCTSETEESSAIPVVVPHKQANGSDTQTLVMSVGHRGRFAGVLGFFRNATGGFDMHYEMVPLGPEWETPPEKEADHPIIKLMQDGYARQVQQRGFLTLVTPTQHPAQLAFPKENLQYIGSQRCQPCHVNEFNQWQTTKHSHAYDNLVNNAKKPSLRQFDPECVRCHTVGFDYVSGFTDEKRTPHLESVGCESCHGPGSAHAANPNNPKFYPALSPWKRPNSPTDRLPALALLQRNGPYSADARRVLNSVDQKTCQVCHDQDNDPTYRFENFWPKVYHSNMKGQVQWGNAGGAPPAGAPGPRVP
jgi:hypothetical protein